MTIIDDLATHKAAITSTADGYISAATAAAAASLAEMQALDGALADMQAAIALERSKMALVITKLTGFSLTQ